MESGIQAEFGGIAITMNGRLLLMPLLLLLWQACLAPVCFAEDYYPRYQSQSWESGFANSSGWRRSGALETGRLWQGSVDDSMFQLEAAERSLNTLTQDSAWQLQQAQDDLSFAQRGQLECDRQLPQRATIDYAAVENAYACRNADALGGGSPQYTVAPRVRLAPCYCGTGMPSRFCMAERTSAVYAAGYRTGCMGTPMIGAGTSARFSAGSGRSSGGRHGR